MFTGVGVALATLFDEDRAVDLDATVTHARRLVDAGARSVTVTGSTGEAPALSADERRVITLAVLDAVGGDVPVLAGTGAASTAQAVALTAAAVRQGVAGVVVLAPPRSSNPRGYYKQVVAAAEGVPVLAYHFPAMSSPGIPVEVVPDLGVFGLKDSSADPNRLMRILDGYEGAVYVGAAALLLQAGATGCAGAILALANLDPATCASAYAGDGAAQRALAADHVAVGRDWPHGLKAAMAKRFGTSPVCRMG